jgi:hypothetical protein
LSDPQLSYEYAKVFQERWPQGEPTILQSPLHTYSYVLNIINKNKKPGEPKERWLDGEATILKSPDYSYLYAKDIIGGRWEKGENSIFTSPDLTFRYIDEIVKYPLQEAEKKLLESNSPEYVFKYSHKILKKP